MGGGVPSTLPLLTPLEHGAAARRAQGAGCPASQPAEAAATWRILSGRGR